MARHVPWPADARPATGRCGATYRAYYGGAYEATCTRPEGHASYHDDGVAWEKHEDYVVRANEDGGMSGSEVRDRYGRRVIPPADLPAGAIGWNVYEYEPAPLGRPSSAGPEFIGFIPAEASGCGDHET